MTECANATNDLENFLLSLRWEINANVNPALNIPWFESTEPFASDEKYYLVLGLFLGRATYAIVYRKKFILMARISMSGVMKTIRNDHTTIVGTSQLMVHKPLTPHREEWWVNYLKQKDL